MNNSISLNSNSVEKEISRRRVLVMFAIIVALFSIVTSRYYYLQVKLNHDFRTLSDQNRVHGRSIAPLRGLITDRNGLVLARNVPSFELNIIPEHSKDINQLISTIDSIIGLKKRQIDEFKQLRKRYRYRPYQSIPLRFRLSEKEVAQLSVNEYRLPGMEIRATLARDYPYDSITAHVLGYVGRINAHEQEIIDKELYEGIHLIGKIGIEKQYESSLIGSLGYESVETDVSGKVLRILERQDAQSGSEVQLHLDGKLQQRLYDNLKANRGAAVAIEVDTGGVLAMVSTPSYDPNLFVKGISHKDYNAILSNLDKPLLNRTLSGQYPPGSIVKPTFALSALQAKAVNAELEIEDEGFIQLEEDGRKYRDWKREGHGMINLRQSIAQSCDIYFYGLGLRTGINTLKETANAFSIGVKTGIDMPQEKLGLMPSPQYKKWSDGETVNTVIGQGDLLVTPLQMAQNVAIIARRGSVITPTMVKRIDEQKVITNANDQINIKDEYWNLVHQAMVDVIHHYSGTAVSLKRKTSFRIASKTGTAQVVSIEQDAEYDSEQLLERQRDHAWFIAFAPVDNPKIAIAVIVENGESSSMSAGRIAVDGINYWLENESSNIIVRGES